MNRPKYIHEKRKSRSNLKTKRIKHNPKYIEDYENLSFHEPMRNRNSDWTRRKTVLDFWLICKKYLKSKIGEKWDDVYSDMVKKTNPKYRHLLEKYVWDWDNPYKSIYYINGVAHRQTPHYRSLRYRINKGKCVNIIYVDDNGVLNYHETEKDLLSYSKNRLREKKLERILKNINK